MRKYKVYAIVDGESWNVYNGFIRSSYDAIKELYVKSYQYRITSEVDYDNATVCKLHKG